MSDFFEKLKKGMETEEPITEDILEEPMAEFAVSPVVDDEPIEKPKKKKKTKSQKKEVEKVEVEEIPDFFEGGVGELTVDIYQSGKDLIIKSAIAGVESEDLDIVIENDLVIIKGSREESSKEEKADYFFQECHWGAFKREIALPLEVDSSRAKAKLEKGILIIRMPIIEHQSKTKVSIE